MDDKTKEVLEKLEKGILETMNGEAFKNYLKVQASFHNYSLNNSFLIYLQKPTATRVAGFEAWKKLGRFVKKGEVGIRILAPQKYTYEKSVTLTDPKTKQPVIDPSTKKPVEAIEKTEGITFRQVSVFDVSQTDGKPLPTLCNELTSNGINAKHIITGIKEISECPIVDMDIKTGAKGYYSRGEGIIAIKEGMSLDQTAKTLIHEYAHSILHNSDESAKLPRQTKEVQAESVAFVVSERFGIDTSEYSFEYLSSWSSDKTLPELKAELTLIQKTANSVIEKLTPIIEREMLLSNEIISHDDNFTKGEIRIQGKPFEFSKDPISQNYVSAVDVSSLGMTSGDFNFIVSNAIEETIKSLEIISPSNPFERELINGFEDPEGMEAQIDDRKAYLNEILSDVDAIKLGKMDSTDYVIVSPSTKTEGIQLTYFKNDEPISDAQFSNQSELIDRLESDGYGIKLDAVPKLRTIEITHDKAIEAIKYGKSVILLDANGSEIGTTKGLSKLEKHLSSGKVALSSVDSNIVTNLKSMNSKDRITQLYKTEFKSIEHISDKSAEYLDKLINTSNKPISIRQLKASHSEIGKNIENLKPEQVENFNELNAVIDDLKHAQLTEKRLQAQSKAIEQPSPEISCEL